MNFKQYDALLKYNALSKELYAKPGKSSLLKALEW